MPNTTDFRFGDVVLIRFPFSNQRSAKQRPAAIVSSAAYNADHPDLVIMAITSHVGMEAPRWEIIIERWAEAGLLKPSALKPVLATVERRLIRRRLGRLNDDDLARLRDLLDVMLAE